MELVLERTDLTPHQLSLVRKLVTTMTHNWVGVDLTGRRTLDHCIRIYDDMTRDNLPFYIRLAGLLHDVLEDSPITADELLGLGVPEVIVESIQILTFDGHDRSKYIESVRSNTISRMVKIYDLRDNMNLLRLNKFNQSTYNRFMKYAKEYYYLVDTNKERIE